MVAFYSIKRRTHVMQIKWDTSCNFSMLFPTFAGLNTCSLLLLLHCYYNFEYRSKHGIEGKGYFCWQYSQGLIIPSWEHHFGHDIEECWLLHSQCLQNLNITGMATILSKCFHLLTLGRARLIINQYLHEQKHQRMLRQLRDRKSTSVIVWWKEIICSQKPLYPISK